MNARFRIRLATVLAAAAIGVAGTACATVDNATRASSSRDMQLAQADTSTTSSSSSATSAAPSAATTSPSAATSATPSSSATTPSTSSSATTTSPAASAGATATPPASDQARRIFDQLDTNHDGMLSFDEFSRATFQQK